MCICLRHSHPKHDTACCQGASSNAKQTKKSRDSSASGSPPACGREVVRVWIRIGFQSYHSFQGVSNRNVQLEAFGAAGGLGTESSMNGRTNQWKIYLQGPKVPQIRYRASSGILPSKTIMDTLSCLECEIIPAAENLNPCSICRKSSWLKRILK